jgi:hypothetical protein
LQYFRTNPACGNMNNVFIASFITNSLCIP